MANNNITLCEECGEKLKTHISDADNQGQTYCRKCGLVHAPEHPMGLTLDSLIDYMIHSGLSAHTSTIRTTAIFHGLKTARLQVAALQK